MKEKPIALNMAIDADVHSPAWVRRVANPPASARDAHCALGTRMSRSAEGRRGIPVLANLPSLQVGRLRSGEREQWNNRQRRRIESKMHRKKSRSSDTFLFLDS